jgi:hypothetical protein
LAIFSYRRNRALTSRWSFSRRAVASGRARPVFLAAPPFFEAVLFFDAAFFEAAFFAGAFFAEAFFAVAISVLLGCWMLLRCPLRA